MMDVDTDWATMKCKLPTCHAVVSALAQIAVLYLICMPYCYALGTYQYATLDMIRLIFFRHSGKRTLSSHLMRMTLVAFSQ